MRNEAVQRWIRALEAVKTLDQPSRPTLAALLDGLAHQHDDRVALLGSDGHLSYRQLATRANRIARWAQANGIARGATVGLLMPNRPDYVAIWLGLTRAGCVVALINTALTGDALLQSIATAGAAHLLVDAELLASLECVRERLPAGMVVWSWSALFSQLEAFDAGALEADELLLPDPSDTALLVYTSGTTGPSKAVKITHARVLEWGLWFAGMMDVQSDDRLYDCLPLYHSTGGIVAIAAMLVRGGSVMIAAGFRARHFWDEVVGGQCTVFFYIGELCRYLVNSPVHELERGHRLRLACGNGLQGEVWTAFQTRFGIPSILEFYAATEGSVALYNCEGRPGAIGRVPPFLASRFPFALIRIDAGSGAPIRDAAGFCVACDPDEPGEAIGRLGARARRFDGYTDAGASALKHLDNVFERGDRWFRTGDLMRRDRAGFIYFVDRMGDTFRWKGENVSTTEVAAVVRSCAEVTDAVVYGVRVPGQEGRAGMAAIVTSDQFDLDRFATELAARLPPYARPLFVRRCSALEYTETFKLSPAGLAAEGFQDGQDPVFVRDAASGRYIPCDAEVCRAIADGTRRT